MSDEVQAKVDAAKAGICRRAVRRAAAVGVDLHGWLSGRRPEERPFPVDDPEWLTSLAAALAWLDEVEDRGGRIETMTRGSYGVKHDVERWARGVYVANGTLILAVLIRGVPYRHDGGLNCEVAVSRRGMKQIEREIRARGER